MPGRQLQVGQARQAAQNLHAKSFHGLAQNLSVGRAAGHVEEHGIEPQLGIEFGVAFDQRGGGAGHAARVDHQHDGHAQDLGQLRGRTLFAHGPDAVEEAHGPFDDGDVAAFVVAAKDAMDFLGREHPAVQVVAGQPRGHAVQARIDEVRPGLEPLHHQSFAGKGFHQAESDGCFSAPAGGAGNDDGFGHMGILGSE